LHFPSLCSPLLGTSTAIPTCIRYLRRILGLAAAIAHVCVFCAVLCATPAVYSQLSTVLTTVFFPSSNETASLLSFWGKFPASYSCYCRVI
jgi:hypothetical protein